MKVILDSNFFLDLVRFRIDLEEIEDLVQKPQLLTLSCVVKELKDISCLKSKSAKNAKAALKLIELKKIEVLESKGRTDEAIVSLADKDTIVATNDTELRKKLKSKGVKTIYLRAKKHLAMG